MESRPVLRTQGMAVSAVLAAVWQWLLPHGSSCCMAAALVPSAYYLPSSRQDLLLHDVAAAINDSSCRCMLWQPAGGRLFDSSLLTVVIGRSLLVGS